MNLKTERSHWKRIKCFPSSLFWSNLKTRQSTAILDFGLSKTRSGRSRDYHDVIVFEKLWYSGMNSKFSKIANDEKKLEDRRIVFTDTLFCCAVIWLFFSQPRIPKLTSSQDFGVNLGWFRANMKDYLLAQVLNQTFSFSTQVHFIRNKRKLEFKAKMQ